MKYIVAASNFFDNEITIKVIEADNWKEAVSKHPIFKADDEEKGDVSWMSDEIEDAKFDAFSADMSFDVVEMI